MPKSSLTQSRLKELLAYNPKTGELTWVAPTNCSIRVGAVAGCYSNGYIRVQIDGAAYMAHRLAWFITYNVWPECIDHINHARDDNRLNNLREATAQENSMNASLSKANKSGVTGVHWHTRDKIWQSSIMTGGKIVYLGRFADKADAVKARKDADNEYGYHINHGIKI